MSIYRIEEGVIFDDNFDTLNSRWVVSPSNSYEHSATDKQLTLNHNNTDRSTNALFELPQGEDDLLLQIQADYTPTMLGDEGGLVVWKNSLEKVEFLESEDSTQAGTYSVWRAIKKQNLWTFFAERNNAWELFDSTICIDPTMAGVVLKNKPMVDYVPLIIDRAILCKGSAIKIGNINSDYIVKLLDETGNVVNEQVVPTGFSGVEMELPSIPFNGQLEIYDKNLEGDYIKVDSTDKVVTMYGGDLFLRGTELSVFWDGVELNDMTPTHLGALKYDSLEEKMTLVNPSTGNVAENITIKVAMYSDEFGWEWADLANDVDGVAGEYLGKKINMGTLFALEERDFWVRITRGGEVTNENKSSMRPTVFMLEVTND